MKRALAERAKQAALPVNGNKVESLKRTSSPQQQEPAEAPLAKIPRTSTSEHLSSSSSTTTTQQAGTKRPRPSVTPAFLTSEKQKRLSKILKEQQQEEDEDDDAAKQSAFYLRHQNRALATELYSLQFAVQQLEAERCYRRQQCLESVKALVNLQTAWTAMENALTSLSSSGPDDENGTETTARPQQTQSSSSSSRPAVVSTGAGDNVESTMALAQELAALADRAKSVENAAESRRERIKEESSQQEGQDREVVFEDKELFDLSHISSTIADRAAALQRWIWPILQQNLPQTPATCDGTEETMPRIPPLEHRTVTLQEELSQCQGEYRLLKSQLTELTSSRDDSMARDRRLRRNIFRLSSGIMTTQQVINALEFDKNDAELQAAVEREVQCKQEGKTLVKSDGTNNQQGSSAMVAAKTEAKAQGENNSKTLVNGLKTEAENSELSQGKIQELEEKLKAFEDETRRHETSIQELTGQLRAKEQEITQLKVTQLSKEDAEKISRIESMRMQLESKEKIQEDLTKKQDLMREQLAKSLGNEKAMESAMDELVEKHKKRWSELLSSSDNGTISDKHKGITAAESASDELYSDQEQQTSSARGKNDSMIQQKLQHKLQQAVEQVRQAETSKENLKTALELNSQLQRKLEELKTKYAAACAAASQNQQQLKQQHASSNHTTPAKEKDTSSSSSSQQKSNNSAPPSHRPSSSDIKRYHKENKRLKIELEACMKSKDAAKSKHAAAERERDGLLETNRKLMQQVAEKDEMNTKSLSTILHLKSLTDKAEKERENLKQSASSASQLALAARLASNAKDRVAEQVQIENNALKQRIEEMESKQAEENKELEARNTEFSEVAGKISTAEAAVLAATKRSDELVQESMKKQEEIRKLEAALSTAQREAREAKQKMETAAPVQNAKDSGGGSFTVEQLNTQVSVLKQRLACPVCHYRDKSCIIMRCRHMHCKECVEERITNRSRKCPTCNIKFAEKDVEDVWLN